MYIEFLVSKLDFFLEDWIFIFCDTKHVKQLNIASKCTDYF